MIKAFEAKIGKMRKAKEFVTYPRKNANEPIIIQADGVIGRFDPATGEGILNAKGSGHKGFIHLNPVLGAEPFTLPAEVLAAAIGAGAVTADGTIVVLG